MFCQCLTFRKNSENFDAVYRPHNSGSHMRSYGGAGSAVPSADVYVNVIKRNKLKPVAKILAWRSGCGCVYLLQVTVQEVRFRIRQE